MDELERIKLELDLAIKNVGVLQKKANQNAEAIKGLLIRLDDMQKDNARNIEELEWRLRKT